MTQEERRLKRQQDTKNAITLLAGLASAALVLIVLVVLGVSFLLKNDNEQVANNQTETQKETQMQTETEERPEKEIRVVS